MGVQQKRLSKKEKKVVAFRARKGKGRAGEEAALEVPIIDVVRDEENENPTQITYQPKKNSDEKPVNKKRKHLDVEDDANGIEIPKPKKQKREVRNAGAGEQPHLKAEKNNSSKYILFVGKCNTHAEIHVAFLYRLTYSTQETLVLRLLKRRLSSTFPNAVSSYP